MIENKTAFVMVALFNCVVLHFPEFLAKIAKCLCLSWRNEVQYKWKQLRLISALKIAIVMLIKFLNFFIIFRESRYVTTAFMQIMYEA